MVRVDCKGEGLAIPQGAVGGFTLSNLETLFPSENSEVNNEINENLVY